jgi:hypothetical protein
VAGDAGRCKSAARRVAPRSLQRLADVETGRGPPLACHLDPANSDAWREGRFDEFLRFMARKSRIVVKSGRRLIVLDAEGAYEARIVGAPWSALTAIDVEKSAKNRSEW